MARLGAVCPSCASVCADAPVYRLDGVPALEMAIYRSQDTARQVPRGDIALLACRTCGLVWNAAFDPSLVAYDQAYESTQTHSTAFNRMHAGLAAELVDRCALVTGDTVVEIGCGQGEFLTLLNETAGVTGLGFDPAFRHVALPDQVTISATLFQETTEIEAALVIMKMTLEHLPDTNAMLSTIHHNVPQCPLFVMVPACERIFAQAAYFDIYYEHCAYFTTTSLTNALRLAGFENVVTWTIGDAQYLCALAVPGTASGPPLSANFSDICSFQARVDDLLAGWRNRLNAWHAAKRRVVLWGGGSKAVGFLTSLNLADEVDAVVDINPLKQGAYLAGSGHPVVAPQALTDSPPDVVIIMNGNYRSEIAADLEARGLTPELCVL
ncbi:MAG: class I SAM-dependent methyltransferase [Geminicoccaceae bacterium]